MKPDMLHSKSKLPIKRYNSPNRWNSPWIFSRLSLPLILLLVTIPNFSFGGQKTNPDSLSVLAITQYKRSLNDAGEKDIRKINYIAEGAIINLKLKDGRRISQVRVNKVAKDHLIISSDELISLSSIQQISVGKTWDWIGSKLLGGLILVIGILSTFLVIWATIGYAGAFAGLLLLWIPGYLWVKALLGKFPELKLNKSSTSVKTVSLSSLSAKARKKLARRSRFYYIKN